MEKAFEIVRHYIRDFGIQTERRTYTYLVHYATLLFNTEDTYVDFRDSPLRMC
jgi:hypothetical protein